MARDEDKVVNQDDFDFKGFDANFASDDSEIEDDVSIIDFDVDDELAKHREEMRRFEFEKSCYCRTGVIIVDDTPKDLETLENLIKENYP